MSVTPYARPQLTPDLATATARDTAWDRSCRRGKALQASLADANDRRELRRHRSPTWPGRTSRPPHDPAAGFRPLASIGRADALSTQATAAAPLRRRHPVTAASSSARLVVGVRAPQPNVDVSVGDDSRSVGAAGAARPRGNRAQRHADDRETCASIEREAPAPGCTPPSALKCPRVPPRLRRDRHRNDERRSIGWNAEPSDGRDILAAELHDHAVKADRGPATTERPRLEPTHCAAKAHGVRHHLSASDDERFNNRPARSEFAVHNRASCLSQGSAELGTRVGFTGKDTCLPLTAWLGHASARRGYRRRGAAAGTLTGSWAYFRQRNENFSGQPCVELACAVTSASSGAHRRLFRRPSKGAPARHLERLGLVEHPSRGRPSHVTTERDRVHVGGRDVALCRAIRQVMRAASTICGKMAAPSSARPKVDFAIASDRGWRLAVDKGLSARRPAPACANARLQVPRR